MELGELRRYHKKALRIKWKKGLISTDEYKHRLKLLKDNKVYFVTGSSYISPVKLVGLSSPGPNSVHNLPLHVLHTFSDADELEMWESANRTRYCPYRNRRVYITEPEGLTTRGDRLPLYKIFK